MKTDIAHLPLCQHLTLALGGKLHSFFKYGCRTTQREIRYDYVREIFYILLAQRPHKSAVVRRIEEHLHYTGMIWVKDSVCRNNSEDFYFTAHDADVPDYHVRIRFSIRAHGTGWMIRVDCV